MPPYSRGVFKNQKVMINCAAYGDPTPLVVWMKGNRLNASLTKKYQAKLIIHDFLPSDEGSYTCNVETSLGRKLSAVIRLCESTLKLGKMTEYYNYRAYKLR